MNSVFQYLFIMSDSRFQHLYTMNVASPAHLAILFKCFCLRGEIEQFEQFVQTTARADDGIDWTVAIDECRSAGQVNIGTQTTRSPRITQNMSQNVSKF